MLGLFEFLALEYVRDSLWQINYFTREM